MCRLLLRYTESESDRCIFPLALLLLGVCVCVFVVQHAEGKSLLCATSSFICINTRGRRGWCWRERVGGLADSHGREGGESWGGCGRKNQWVGRGATPPSCPVSHDECCPVEIYGCQSPPLGTALHRKRQNSRSLFSFLPHDSAVDEISFISIIFNWQLNSENDVSLLLGAISNYFKIIRRE